MSIRREVVISDGQGLHARPAAEIVRAVKPYACRIWMTAEGKRVDAKSVLMVMSLAVRPGTTVVVEAEGEDAEEAVGALLQVLGSERQD